MTLDHNGAARVLQRHYKRFDGIAQVVELHDAVKEDVVGIGCSKRLESTMRSNTW